MKFGIEKRLKKWGGSLGIPLPAAFIKELGLTENDKVGVYMMGDKIIITKLEVKND